MLSKIHPSDLWLSSVILWAFTIRIIHINFNSPFLDESIYIILGRKILDGHFAEVASSISWVGGFPFFYPLLSVIFYNIGGILGSRIFNIFLGTGAVYLIYQFTRRLNLLGSDDENKLAGLAAAILLATSAIPIAFSRLAIYDILSFAIFLLSLVVLQKAMVKDKNWLLTASAVSFFLAFLAKYIVLIYLPFFLMWMFYVGWKKKILNNILKYFWLPLIFLNLGYFGINLQSLKEFFLSQTSKGIPILTIFEDFWRYASFPYLVSMGGLIILSARRRKLSIVLLLASIWPLVVHLLTGEGLSVHQHSFLSLVFILPIAGVFLATIVQKFGSIGFLAVSGVVLLNLFLSIPKVQALESFWPNSDGAAATIKSRVLATDKILAESGDVISLAVYDINPELIGPFVFSYKGMAGTDAYGEAIRDGYFNFVMLDGTSFDSDSLATLEKVINERYSIIYTEGKIRVWQLK